jgi:hypothetical protein
VSGIEFDVTNGCNQIEAQAKAFAAITIAFTQNTKDLQPANDVFNQDSFS